MAYRSSIRLLCFLFALSTFGDFMAGELYAYGRVAERINAIRHEHSEDVLQLRKSGAPQRLFQMSFAKRNQALKAALNDALKLNPSEASFDDALAIVECAETLLLFQQATPFARRAFELDPRSAKAQSACIRLLVNGGEVAQAEQIMDSILNDACENADTPSLYGVLYLGRKRSKDYGMAASHLDKYMRFIIGRVSAIEGEGHRFREYLRTCKEFAVLIHDQEWRRRMFKEYDGMLELAHNALASKSEVPSTSLQLGICDARFQIACELELVPKAQDAMIQWVRTLGALLTSHECALEDLHRETQYLHFALSNSEIIQPHLQRICDEVEKLDTAIVIDNDDRGVQIRACLRILQEDLDAAVAKTNTSSANTPVSNSE